MTPAFHRCLASLPDHGVSEAHASLALALWDRLATLAPSEPNIRVDHDEGLVEFGWNCPKEAPGSTMTAAVHADGQYEWWCFDRDVSPSIGSEEPVAALPDEFWRFAVRFARQPLPVHKHVA